MSGDEWGVSTLVSKEPIGEAGYVRYTFKIPEGKVLPLDMAQQLTLCCLDAGSNVAKSDFFVSSARHVAGKFEIVATRGAKKDEAVLGRESAAFHSVLYEQMEVGDEVAIKPGKSTLGKKRSEARLIDFHTNSFRSQSTGDRTSPSQTWSTSATGSESCLSLTRSRNSLECSRPPSRP